MPDLRRTIDARAKQAARSTQRCNHLPYSAKSVRAMLASGCQTQQRER